MQKVYMEYLAEFKSYGIKKSIISQLKEQGQVAEIVLPENFDYQPKKSAPTIGFLLGQDKSENGEEYYSISQSYLDAILNTGVKIRFLDYENPEKQMNGCDGAILPGGVFDSPSRFYVDGPVSKVKVGKRCLAYQSVANHAYKTHKPLLGICAGAQMIGALLGNMKMYHSLKDMEATSLTARQHKPDRERGQKVCPHMIQFTPDSPIYKALKIDPKVSGKIMNSRHGEGMVHLGLQKALEETGINPAKVKMEVYAVSKDGIPEIWGNLDVGFLCVQGHPEDWAEKDKDGKPNFYQRIYDWVVVKAKEYKNANERLKAQKAKDRGV